MWSLRQTIRCRLLDKVLIIQIGGLIKTQKTLSTSESVLSSCRSTRKTTTSACLTASACSFRRQVCSSVNIHRARTSTRWITGPGSLPNSYLTCSSKMKSESRLELRLLTKHSLFRLKRRKNLRKLRKSLKNQSKLRHFCMKIVRFGTS